MAPPLWAGGIVGSGAREQGEAGQRRHLQLDTSLLDALEVMSDREFQAQLSTHASLQDSLAEWHNRFSPLLAGSPAQERFSPSVAAYTPHPLGGSGPVPVPVPEPEPEPEPEPQSEVEPRTADLDLTRELEPQQPQLQAANISLGSKRGSLRRGELLTKLGPQAYDERRRHAAASHSPSTVLQSPMCWIETTTGPAVRAAMRDCVRLGGCDEGTHLRRIAYSLRQHAQINSYLDGLFPAERDGDESLRSNECDTARIDGACLDGSGNSCRYCGDRVAELLAQALWNVYEKAPKEPLLMLAQLLDTAAYEQFSVAEKNMVEGTDQNDKGTIENGEVAGDGGRDTDR